MSLLLLFQSAATGAISFNAEAGSISLIGVANTFTRSRVMNAVAATYSKTGIAAAITNTRKLTLATNSFNQVGFLAVVTKTRNISSLPTSYSVGGVPASTVKTFQVFADAGIYNSTGANSTPVRTFSVNADNTTYNVTGYNEAGIAFRNIPAMATSYAKTGFSSYLYKDLKVTLHPSSYNVGGISSYFFRAYSLAANFGSYSLGTFAAITRTDRNVQAIYNVYTYTGQVVAFTMGVSSAASGSYNLNGSYIAVDRTFGMNLASGSYNVTGIDSTLVYGTSNFLPGSYTFTGYAAQTIVGRAVKAYGLEYWNMYDDAVQFHITGDGSEGSTTVTNIAPNPTTITKANVVVRNNHTLVDGGSLHFPGNAYIWGNLNNKFLIDSNFAIFMTIKPTSVAAQAGLYNAYGISAGVSVRLIISSTQSIQFILSSTTLSGPTISAGNVYHIAAGVIGGTQFLIVNGVQYTTTAAFNSVNTNYTRFTVGALYQASYSSYYNGYIDEVKVINGSKYLTLADVITAHGKKLYSTQHGIKLLTYDATLLTTTKLIANKLVNDVDFNTTKVAISFESSTPYNIADDTTWTTWNSVNISYPTGYDLLGGSRVVLFGNSHNHAIGNTTPIDLGKGFTTFGIRLWHSPGFINTNQNNRVALDIYNPTSGSRLYFLYFSGTLNAFLTPRYGQGTVLIANNGTGIQNSLRHFCVDYSPTYAISYDHSGTNIYTLYRTAVSIGMEFADFSRSYITIGQLYENRVSGTANGMYGYLDNIEIKIGSTFYNGITSFPAIPNPHKLVKQGFELTGVANSMKWGKGLGSPAEPFTITGYDVTFGGIRYPDAGFYTYNGYPLNMARDVGTTIHANPTNFNVNGVDATLAYNPSMNPAAGSINITGVSAGSRRDRVENFLSFSITWSGNDVEFLRDRLGAVEAGSYTWTMYNFEVTWIHMMDNPATSYVYTGIDAATIKDKPLPAMEGSYAITGSDFTVYRDYVPITFYGEYNVDGKKTRLAKATRYPGIDYVLHDVIYGDAAQFTGTLDMVYDIETGRFVKLLSKDTAMLL